MAWIDVTGPAFWVMHASYQNGSWSGNDLIWDGSGYFVLLVTGTWAHQLRPKNVRISYTASHTDSPVSTNWQVVDNFTFVGKTLNGFTAGANAETIPCDLGWYQDFEKIIIPAAGAGHSLTITKIEYEEADPSIYDYIDVFTFSDTATVDYNRTDPGHDYNTSSVTQTLDFRADPYNIWPDHDNQPNHLRMIVNLSTDDPVDRKFKLTYSGTPSEIVVFEQTRTLVQGDNVLEFDFDQPPPSKIFNRLYMIAADNATALNVCTILTCTFSYVTPAAVEIPAYVERYQFKMTGTPDLILPMSSFSARLISGTDSYLQVVLPGATEYIDEIEARSAEDLVVTWQQVNPVTGAVVSDYEIVTVNFENLSVAKGANSQSLTLTGHKQKTYNTPKAVPLTGKYIENGDSDTFAFLPNVYPKDTFGALTIATLTINVNTQSSIMTVTYE
jgi:hypothetical protein